MNYYMSNIYVPNVEDMIDELERFYAHRNIFADDALEKIREEFYRLLNEYQVDIDL